MDTLRRVSKSEMQFERQFRHATEALNRLVDGEGEYE
jgi:hypothetical protein